MKRIIFRATVLSLVIAAVGLTFAIGQGIQSGRNGAALAKPKAVPRIVTPPPRSIKPFRVVPLPATQGEARILHKSLGDALSRLEPLPGARLDHFRWLDQTEHVRVVAWHAFVEDVVQTPTGYRVTLRVSPRVTSEGGGSATVIDFIREEYELANGQWHFRGWSEAPEAVRVIMTD